MILKKQKDIGWIMSKRNKRLIDYQEDLLQSLHNQDEAIAYLNAALNDEDPHVFLLALKSVLEAQGIDISTLSAETQLNRENLYRMLSIRGNPKLTSIRSVLNTLGLQLAVQPYK